MDWIAGADRNDCGQLYVKAQALDGSWVLKGLESLDLGTGELVKLKPASDAGSGKSQTDENRKLAEIVGKMNDLFAGDLTDADLVG